VARVGEDYTHTLNAAGGKPPLRWRFFGFNVAGLIAAENGTIRGKPEQPGSKTFDTEVTDQDGKSDRKTFTLEVLPRAPLYAFPSTIGGVLARQPTLECGSPPPVRVHLVGPDEPIPLNVSSTGSGFTVGSPGVTAPGSLFVHLDPQAAKAEGEISITGAGYQILIPVNVTYEQAASQQPYIIADCGPVPFLSNAYYGRTWAFLAFYGPPGVNRLRARIIPEGPDGHPFEDFAFVLDGKDDSSSPSRKLFRTGYYTREFPFLEEGTHRGVIEYFPDSPEAAPVLRIPYEVNVSQRGRSPELTLLERVFRASGEIRLVDEYVVTGGQGGTLQVSPGPYKVTPNQTPLPDGESFHASIPLNVLGTDSTIVTAEYRGPGPPVTLQTELFRPGAIQTPEIQKAQGGAATIPVQNIGPDSQIVNIQYVPGTPACVGTVEPGQAVIPGMGDIKVTVKVTEKGATCGNNPPGAISFTPVAPPGGTTPQPAAGEPPTDDGVTILLPDNPVFSAAKDRQAGSCTGTGLTVLITHPRTTAVVRAGVPVAVRARVFDQCGVEVSGATVVVNPGNGDAELRMIDGGRGRYAGTWTPIRVREGLSRMVARARAGESAGAGSVYLLTRANPGAALLEAAGLVNAASFRGDVHAAGELVTLFGANLAARTEASASLPLPPILAGAELLVDGSPIPLLAASAGQVNAVLPFGLLVNRYHELALRRGTSLSPPVRFWVGEANPGIFTRDGTGKGQGIILDGQFRYLDSANPGRAGGAFTAYLSGLGEVDPPVAAGVGASATVLSRVRNRVRVTIGGVEVTEMPFVGLAPGSTEMPFVGLTPGLTGVYQLVGIIPAGVPPGDAVPVVVTAGGVSSEPVTMAVRGN
jgi:uncharacterized protein (TIGR03437 family)